MSENEQDKIKKFSMNLNPIVPISDDAEEESTDTSAEEESTDTSAEDE